MIKIHYLLFSKLLQLKNINVYQFLFVQAINLRKNYFRNENFAIIFVNLFRLINFKSILL